MEGWPNTGKAHTWFILGPEVPHDLVHEVSKEDTQGRIAERVRDLIRQTGVARGVSIIRGAVSPDHIHLLQSAPPTLAPAKLARGIKGGRRD
jgi:REP element-mobilizing transposase RayT